MQTITLTFSIDTPDDRAVAKRALMAEELAYQLCAARDDLRDFLKYGAELVSEDDSKRLSEILTNMSLALEAADYI